MNPLTHIAFDQHVLIKLPSENSKISLMKKDGVISLGKFGSFNVNEIIGYPLGTTFDIIYDSNTSEATPQPEQKQPQQSGPTEQQLKTESADKNAVSEPPKKKQKPFVVKPVGKIVARTDVYDCKISSDESEMTMASSATNQDLINIGSQVQKMTSEEIEKLKESSVDGNAIIQKIIESHGNFHQKTSFSQEKYLTRKQKKFAKYFTVEYLTSANLLQYLFDKGDIMRANDMSIESMSMIMNLGNIQPSGHYLVMDESGGLLVYALMERMFGGSSEFKDHYGSITMVHENEHSNLDLLKYSNYAPEFISKYVKTISVWEFFEPATKEELEKDITFLTEEQLNKLHPHKRGTYHRKLKWLDSQLSLVKIANKKDYDGLVVNTTLHLPGLITRMGEYLHGSRPIVCYSQFREPLLELSHTLYNDLKYLAPTVLETRCRPYQSIRGKIHPVMTMRGGGGYLMWCHRVLPVDPATLTPSAPEPQTAQE